MQYEKIIKKQPLFLRAIDKQPHELCLLAILTDFRALRYVKDQTHEICLYAIRCSNGTALKYIKNQTHDMCLEAIRRSNGIALKYIKNQTHDMCLEAVNLRASMIQFVNEQTEGICLLAVQKWAHALQYVRIQSEQICLEAVKHNGLMLEYVLEQTEEICIYAIQNNVHSFNFIKTKTINCYLEAIRLDEKSIFSINDNFLEIFKLIVQNKIRLSEDIKDFVDKYLSDHLVPIKILYINSIDNKSKLITKYNLIEQFIRDKFGVVGKCVYNNKREILGDIRYLDGLFYVKKNDIYMMYRKTMRLLSKDELVDGSVLLYDEWMLIIENRLFVLERISKFFEVIIDDL